MRAAKAPSRSPGGAARGVEQGRFVAIESRGSAHRQRDQSFLRLVESLAREPLVRQRVIGCTMPRRVVQQCVSEEARQ
jgi:hypothetical protein